MEHLEKQLRRFLVNNQTERYIIMFYLLKRIPAQIGHFFLWGCVVLGTTVREALAATIGERANAMTETIKGLGSFTYMGLALFGAGILGIRKAQQRQEGLGMPLTTVIIGVVLMSIGAIVSISSETATGSDSNELDKLGL